MNAPLHCEAPLPPTIFADVRRRAIFDCCKWDPQVEDVPVLAPYPLVIPAAEWQGMCAAAENLYQQTLTLECALLRRPHLHRKLGMPRAICQVLSRACREHPATGALRVMRFDFHATEDGWRVSEVNSDVPGGYIESSGFAGLMAACFPHLRSAGDPVRLLADGIIKNFGPEARIALVHATAYVDDRSAMEYLARRFEDRGLVAHRVAPDALTWKTGRAHIADPASPAGIDFILRFYPAEWLPSLPRSCGWSNFFIAGCAPQCNPATALLTQSKRWPLFCDELDLELPTWRTLLPQTAPASDALRASDKDSWILKPALGRVGDGVGIPGVTPPREWKLIARSASWFGRHWVAQRRFRALPIESPDGPAFPCIGVFVIDGHAAGAYGRIAARPLIDTRARDIAVLIQPPPAALPASAVRSEANVAA